MTKMKIPFFFFMTMIAFLCSGCGTFFTQQESRQVFFEKNKYGKYDKGDDCCIPTPHIYSGCVWDIQILGFPFLCPCGGEGGLAFLAVWPIAAPLSIIDLPLSAVADTLILPYTVYRQYKFGNITEVCHYCKEKKKEALKKKKIKSSVQNEAEKKESQAIKTNDGYWEIITHDVEILTDLPPPLPVPTSDVENKGQSKKQY